MPCRDREGAEAIGGGVVTFYRNSYSTVKDGHLRYSWHQSNKDAVSRARLAMDDGLTVMAVGERFHCQNTTAGVMALLQRVATYNDNG